MRHPFLHRILIMLSVLTFAACEPDTTNVTSPIKALSTQSAMIVETGNLPASRNVWMQNAWMQQFENDPAWKLFTDELEPLSILTDSLNDFLSRRRMFFSVELIGKSSFGILASTQINDASWQRMTSRIDQRKEDYAGHQIYSLTEGETTLYLAMSSAVLLCSAHKGLIEDGIRRLQSDHALDSDKQFIRMRNTSNPKDHFNIYMQYSEFAGLLNGLLRDPKTDYVSEVSQWTALDANFTTNGFLLSGLSDMGDSLPSYLDAFNGQRGPKIQSARIVPSAAALWINFSTHNFLTHQRKRESYRQNKGTARRFNDHLQRLGIDFDAAFSRWVDNDYGIVYLSSTEHPRHKRVAYFSIRDAEGFIDAFTPVLDLNADLIQFRGESIYRSSHPNWLRAVVGRAYDALEARYIWFHNGYVFFAPAVDILTEFMTDVLDERTLGQSLPYRSFTAKIPDRAAIQITFLPNQASGLINDFIPNTWKAALKRNDELVEHTPYVSLQFQPQGKMAFTGLYAAYQRDVEQVVKPVWSADLASGAIAGPFLLKNHYNQQNEIAVQDHNDVLYLFGSTGKLLWKKGLNGRIIGGIHQVDLFRNGKLQMAFNTSTHIYMLDRNGNPVEPFPAKAPDSISSPMAVFDYDKTRNYRFVFACGNSIYNWDKTAKEVKGWELKTVDGIVLREPEHHVAGNKDYLVFITDNNLAYLTDRRGRVRVSDVLKLPKSHSGAYNVQINSHEKTIQLANITLDGELITILSSGKQDKTRIGKLPDRAQMKTWKDQMLIYGDNQMEWKDQTKPVSIELEQPITGYPHVFGTTKPKYFAAAGNENQIYVFDEDGQLLSGFPVYGTNKLILGSLFPSGGSVYMITITPENKLVVYLIQ